MNPICMTKGGSHHIFRAWLREYEKAKGIYSFDTSLFWAIWKIVKKNFRE